MKFTNIIRTVFLSLPAIMMASCQEKVEEPNSLTVSPADGIEFNATGNEDVVLTVETDASSWEYTAPEWIVATKDANHLTVNAEDNTSEVRYGRIEFTAGNAEKVSVTVVQNAPDGSGASLKGSISDASGETDLAVVADVIKKEDKVLTINVELASPAENDVEFFVAFDREYINEYKQTHEGVKCELCPADLVSLPDGGKVTVPAGETTASIQVTVKASDEMMMPFQNYLLPLKAVDNNNVAFTQNRVNYLVKKDNIREMKNLLYFEVNDTNPLNALEINLEDGTPFFDAVVLFSANIVYDTYDQMVKLWNNPNVQALLDNSETYIQPLRKRGIKVYLGLLGHHTPAGLCQLSDWGAKEWADEVSDAVLQYKLDGVAMDDEYSKLPLSDNKWFTEPSGEAGSRLCYELKKAMGEKCIWDTEVEVYKLGGFNTLHAVDGHEPGEFVDFWVGDYGLNTYPEEGMTMKDCCGRSIHARHGKGGWPTTEDARAMKEYGYGWLMWFALDPSSYKDALGWIDAAAQGIHEQKLAPVTGVYKKIGEGEFDPVRYDR